MINVIGFGFVIKSKFYLHDMYQIQIAVLQSNSCHLCNWSNVNVYYLKLI